MNRFGYILLSAILLSACTVREGADLQPRRFKVEASLEEETRVSLTQDQSSLGLIARWQEDDAVKVFLSDASSLSDAGTVRIESISDDGHKAIFYYSIPDDFRIGLGTYYLYAFTINSYSMVVDWELQCNGSIIRSPLSSFRAPVMYESDSVGEDSYGYFQHYGVYELLHVYNNSDADISFSLNGFTASAIWYRSTGAIKVPSMEFVVSSAAARTPVDVSAPVTIPAHGSDVIVSWYIPTGHAVTDAQLYASINGEVVKTSNKLYSDIIPQVGHAYHMYAEWDGNVLSFISNGKEPLEVETVSASFDPDFFTGHFSGALKDAPEGSVKSVGFRFWKDESPEDYVEFDAEVSEDNTFSLNLEYNDFVQIAGSNPVKGAYKTSAFALNRGDSRFHGDILSFTIDRERPAPAIVNVDPASLDFGPVAVGSSISKQLKISNTGEGVLKFHLSAEGEAFTLAQEGEVTLASGEFYEAAVSFSPEKLGSYSGSILITSNDSENPEQTVQLQGEGVELDPGAGISLSRSYIDFEDREVGAVSKRELKITSTGQNPLKILSVTCREGFATDFDSWSETTIAPGESRVLTITFFRPAAKYYQDRIIIKSNAAEKPSTTCLVFGYSLEITTPEAVDIGLSVKWADRHIGSRYEDDKHCLCFAWGETETKDLYSSDTYKWYVGDDPYSDDGKDVLNPEDDAAHVLLGGRWRMPTLEDARELVDTWWDKNPDYEWTWEDSGFRVTYIPNGNSIIVPTTGYRINLYMEFLTYGIFWTSTRSPDESYRAYFFDYNKQYSPGVSTGAPAGPYYRECGMPIRAVCE